MRTVHDAVRIITEAARGKTVVIFVCGFGGAGKSTLCHYLSCTVKVPSVAFETDWYLKYSTTERRERIRAAKASKDQKLIEQEENPKNWYAWPDLTSGLNELKEAGHLAIRNAWSQHSGKKELSVDLELPKNQDSVILCDGIYLLHDDIVSAADLVILLDTPIETCRERANMRDGHRSSKDYLDYKAFLHDRYDKPYFDSHRERANLIVSSNFPKASF
jgi:uridine kinase